MNLTRLPTSELLRELNLRVQTPTYEVREIPPFTPEMRPRWGVYVDGATRQTDRGYRWPDACAVCTSKPLADNIADLLNQQAAQRREADAS